MIPAVGSMLRRGPLTDAGSTVLGQVLSSGSNLALQLGLALSFEPDRFGVMVVALSVYYFALAMARALVGDPLVAAGSSADGGAAGSSNWSAGRRRLLVISVAAALILALPAAVAGGSSRWLLLAIAASIPALLLQDGYRYRAWAERRPGTVIVIDGVWLAAVVAGLIAGTVARSSEGGPALSAGVVVVGAWLAGGWCSAAIGHRLSGSPGPQPPAPPAGLDDHRSLSASQVLLAIDAQVLPSALAAVGGPAAGGGMRAGVLPFLPLSTALGALRVLALPRLRSRVDSGQLGATTSKFMVAFAAICAALAVPTLLLLQLVPDQWLGPTGRSIAPWFSAGALIVSGRMVGLVPADAVALAAGPAVAIRHRLATSALDWTAALGALALWGLGAAFWARAVAVWCAVAWWSLALARYRHHTQTPAAETDPAPSERPKPLAATRRP